jgi:hypothetical protein
MPLGILAMAMIVWSSSSIYKWGTATPFPNPEESSASIDINFLRIWVFLVKKEMTKYQFT